MKKKESIDIVIDSETKKIAESVFEQFGITKSEAIELFYRQVATTKDIPYYLYRNHYLKINLRKNYKPICLRSNFFSKISSIGNISPSIVINLWSLVARILEPSSRSYSNTSCSPLLCH